MLSTFLHSGGTEEDVGVQSRDLSACYRRLVRADARTAANTEPYSAPLVSFMEQLRRSYGTSSVTVEAPMSQLPPFPSVGVCWGMVVGGGTLSRPSLLCIVISTCAIAGPERLLCLGGTALNTLLRLFFTPLPPERLINLKNIHSLQNTNTGNPGLHKHQAHNYISHVSGGLGPSRLD